MARRALILVEGHARSTGLLYVQAAQRLGLHPITLSADPAQYDYLAAEGIEAIRVDTDNLDALIAECSRLRATYDIAGITSPWEAVYATVGKLCRYFDLLGPNPASIERCCDKFTQRQLLAEAGVPTPAYRLATNATDVESFAVEIGLPVILKPAVGVGSRGVRLCRTLDELAEHTTFLLGGKHIWRSSPRILVEEFAQGPYYSADIMGNEVIAIGTADFGPPPHFVFREFTFPAPLTHDEHGRIAAVSLSCLRALGLGWGPTGIEFRWTKRGPVVIEVNPRLHGTPTPQLVKLAYGVDLVTEHIRLVIGEEWDLRKRHSQTAAARFLVADRDGTLEWIAGDSQAAAIPGVAEVKFYVEPQTQIIRKGESRDTIGHVIAASHTPARSKAILQRAVNLVGWSITSFPTAGK
ncbi:MAG: ATP-grasp domain-containing protein [Mesorhizobium sp.]|uniref:ATP-grasp domain-containing protein n=1 Tax=unclassified Mesorhizobium TaxID=325217 RepID=UPI000F74F020|nr:MULTISPECIES: acetyl-CoA carboxylase biotin carboxylase subunit family protein [unclassified Mesorhizobium]AZO50289.1 ATP-grasp domain-containing protein [Mesorhizobium sp. M4B.F.Ca.ET.058.02.1.1]RWD32122.1 MAG: ATP-grasp domain-containing protein [Mesorhizobium sp.]TIU24249.1 MAG: ATP-grasp domain-containing protein [Mesorhizobium sp.]TIW11037.1 MAG: ATP-grasp domain-containing protein [Mesorhizobium sp.]TIW36684.1 MAG: ATP-grasp domain-containing protein [Mesorhizobium sp.]